jgi:hypothetical protein
MYVLNNRGKISRISNWFQIYYNYYIAKLQMDTDRVLEYAGMFMYSGNMPYDMGDEIYELEDIVPASRGLYATLCPVYSYKLYDKFMTLGKYWSKEYEGILHSHCVIHNKTKYLAGSLDYIRYHGEAGLPICRHELSDAKRRRIYKYSIIAYLYDLYKGALGYSGRRFDKYQADIKQKFKSIKVISSFISKKIFNMPHLIRGVVVMTFLHSEECTKYRATYIEALQSVYKKYRQLCVAALEPEIPYYVEQ